MTISELQVMRNAAHAGRLQAGRRQLVMVHGWLQIAWAKVAADTTHQAGVHATPLAAVCSTQLLWRCKIQFTPVCLLYWLA
jgi:hypothetical protein